MKKLLSTIFAALLMSVNASAIPVYPHPVKHVMPDGKTITIIGHGDEFHNYLTTSDGYTVVTCPDNYFRYAKLDGNQLVATNIVAHEETERTSAELKFLSTTQKLLKPLANASSIRRLGAADNAVSPATHADVPFIQKASGARQNYRGLVILVNYTDCQFRLGNERANELYTAMLNEKGFTGYTDDYDGRFKNCTGSLRDYFCDNSYGEFDPEFDVYGPYDISRSQYDMRGTNLSQTIAKEVLNLADEDIDYSQYDSDGDGVVDMFYIIYAGYASSYSGNDSRLLWPHATFLSTTPAGFKRDGVKLDRYACSTELYGWKSARDFELNGIGTICHEFSHVLGYMDHYDTGYGGHETPGNWDVMDAGSYLGTCGRTPAGYSAYERLTGGFIAPTTLTVDNVGETFTLNQLNDNKECYRLDTQTPGEFFLLENRQKSRWDTYLPGHGMLVWKVDSTNMNLWNQDRANATDHLCMKLIRANKSYSSDSQNDPFPGSKNITMLTNKTNANLISYQGYESPIIFKKIQENGNVISFYVAAPNVKPVMPDDAIFYESFNDCEGTGGNDGDFKATSATAGFSPDYDEWVTYRANGADQCARFGSTSSPKGYAITPSISLEEGKNYTLTFRAAPYYTQTPDLKVEVNEGTAELSTEEEEPSPVVHLITQPAAWTDFSVNLTGSGDVKLKFSGQSTKTYAFFLDEVMIRVSEVSAIKNIDSADTEHSSRIYNLNGQQVASGTKGIVISNGKKCFIK